MAISETGRKPTVSVLVKLAVALAPLLTLVPNVALIVWAGEFEGATTAAQWIVRIAMTLGALILLLQQLGAPIEDKRQIVPLLLWTCLLACLSWGVEDPISVWALFYLKSLILLAWVWSRTVHKLEALFLSRTNSFKSLRKVTFELPNNKSAPKMSVEA